MTDDFAIGIDDVTDAAERLGTSGKELESDLNNLYSSTDTYPNNTSPVSNSFAKAMERATATSRKIATKNKNYSNKLLDNTKNYSKQDNAFAQSYQSNTNPEIDTTNTENVAENPRFYNSNSDNSISNLENILTADNTNLLNQASKLTGHADKVTTLHKITATAHQNVLENWSNKNIEYYQNKLDRHLNLTKSHINELDEVSALAKNSYYEINTQKQNIKNTVNEIKELAPEYVKLNIKNNKMEIKSTGDTSLDKKISQEANNKFKLLQQQVKKYNEVETELQAKVNKTFVAKPTLRTVKTTKATKTLKTARRGNIAVQNPNVSKQEHSDNKIPAKKLDERNRKYLNDVISDETKKCKNNNYANTIKGITINGQYFLLPKELQSAIDFLTSPKTPLGAISPIHTNNEGYLTLYLPIPIFGSNDPGGGIKIPLSIYMPTNQQRLDRFKNLRNQLNITDTYKDSSGVSHPVPHKYLLAFNPDTINEGRAIISIGNSDTVKKVGVFVPGAGVNLGHLQSELGQTKALMNNNYQNKAGILFMGYDDPAGIAEAGSMFSADNGAKHLQAFINERPRATGATWNIMGHSYGGEIVARAAQQTGGLHVKNAIFLGNPGLPIDHAAQFENNLHAHYHQNAQGNWVPEKGHMIVNTLPFDIAGLIGSWHGNPQLRTPLGDINIPFLHNHTSTIPGVLGNPSRHVNGLPDVSDLGTYLEMLQKHGLDMVKNHTEYFDDADNAQKIGAKLFQD